MCGRRSRPRVPQLEADTADVERQRFAVRLVGIPVVRRPFEPVDPELPAVDVGVVARGRDVAVEAGRDGFVRHDARRGSAAVAGVGLVPLHTEDVVDVPMGEHGGVQRIRAPLAQHVVHPPGQERAARVDEHHAFGGREGGDVRERGNERVVAVEVGERATHAEQVALVHVGFPTPQPVRDVEQIGRHGPQSRKARARMLARRNRNMFHFGGDDTRHQRHPCSRYCAGPEPGRPAPARPRRRPAPGRAGRFRRRADA